MDVEAVPNNPCPADENPMSPELTNIIEEIAILILRERPTNINNFLADYFENRDYSDLAGKQKIQESMGSIIEGMNSILNSVIRPQSLREANSEFEGLEIAQVSEARFSSSLSEVAWSSRQELRTPSESEEGIAQVSDFQLSPSLSDVALASARELATPTASEPGIHQASNFQLSESLMHFDLASEPPVPKPFSRMASLVRSPASVVPHLESDMASVSLDSDAVVTDKSEMVSNASVKAPTTKMASVRESAISAKASSVPPRRRSNQTNSQSSTARTQSQWTMPPAEAEDGCSPNFWNFFSHIKVVGRVLVGHCPMFRAPFHAAIAGILVVLFIIFLCFLAKFLDCLQ